MKMLSVKMLSVKMHGGGRSRREGGGEGERGRIRNRNIVSNGMLGVAAAARVYCWVWAEREALANY